ncbi:ion channel regulatory protein UNC-93 [Chloropicon primus]|uniref:MFS general substrate transporter n=1 Tax=Chloropicon primus TaxID=1764295 RepID=A0A5B8MJP3_9CHLO|nr:hypothetical protein A3770_03p21280 [Chloropicon primus]UPQ98822.1 ion channel regulatory protein UNC-93 [Chloropicon primus]|eukprot:QDZ19610.1 hypothetical protein A3770_03p21280 [Chloropicon primus]
MDKRRDDDSSMTKGVSGIATICVSSFLVFMAFNSMQNLESTLNKGDGTTAVGVIYLAIIGSQPFAPSVIGWVGRKWALVLGASSYVLFIVTNLYPIWQVMIPAAIVLGLGGAILWPTTLSLIKHFSAQHARAKGLDKEKCLDQFSSAFWGSFQFAQLTGSLIIYLITRNKKPDQGGVDDDSHTPHSTTVLIFVFIACSSIGVFVNFLTLEDVDSSESGQDEDSSDEEEATANNLDTKSAMDLLLSPQSLLLIGVYFYNGIEQSFAWCDFTSEMVLAAYDNKEAMIGILMLCYAASNSIVGSLASQLPSTPKVTRSSIVFAITTQSICVSVANFLFQRQKAPLYITAIFLGAGDALLNTKIGLLLGMDFKGKQHVIMVSMWRGLTALGCALPFFLSGHTGINFNVTLLAGSGAVAISLFLGYWGLRVRKSGDGMYSSLLQDSR